MPKRLTQKEYEQRVFEAVGNKYSVISLYQGRSKPITLHCNVHNYDFTTTAECFMRGANDVRSSCPLCTQDEKNKDKVELICAYCHQSFFRAKSKLENSKSGKYFCCREHKDLAQRIDSGAEFDDMRPEHYGNAVTTYRETALRFYPHKCAVCGWDEDERILQIHHRDGDRSHNQVENLIPLCPNCHWKITLNLYTLTEDNKLCKR